MKLECPGCSAVYKVDDNKIRNISKITCPKCKGYIPINNQTNEQEQTISPQANFENISQNKPDVLFEQNKTNTSADKATIESLHNNIQDLSQRLRSIDIRGLTQNKFVVYLIFGVICATGLIAFFYPTKTQSAIWYNYGNGLVNLSNVHNIHASMSFSLTLKNKNQYGGEINERVLTSEPITLENVKKIKEALKKNSDKWESVSSSAEIKFDSFTLRLPSFKEAGVKVNDNGCIELAEYWLKTYNNIVSLLRPYNP